MFRSNRDGVKNERFFVGSGRLLTIRQVVDIYRKVTGEKVNVAWRQIPYRRRQIMVPQRGPSLPGWKAEVELETGIRMMLEQSGSLAEKMDKAIFN